MPIDTHVDADPASCRTTAQWLDGVARAGATSADEVVGARNDSAGCWSGPAGDAFRDQAGRIGAAGDTTSAQARIGAQALDEFAGSVQGVLDTMSRARADAAAAGLPVTGETIGDPVAPPGPLPTPPVGQFLPPEQVAAHEQATTVATTQQAAFDRARQVTDEARTRYTEAQTDLVARMRAPTDEAVQAVKDVALVVSSVTSTLGGLHGAARTWEDVAAKAALQRQILTGLMLAPGVPLDVAARQAARSAAEEVRAGGARTANANALRTLTGGASETSIGGRILDGLTWAPGQRAETGLLAAAKPVLARLPVTSLVSSGVGFTTDVAAGRSATSAAAKQGTALAVGAGVSWAATAAGTAAVTALGVASVAALPVTLVAIAAGAGAAYLVGYHWDDIEAGVEDLVS
ncbi:hypothetical protein [Actinomycetospora soli]|uniref:hypothetical protein n=1 Tax=Actinomycetospora soli TaxID=2893887 RepID=UPI001E3A32A4|nr:hypothetical protein [Actinomycetospora soli]MCD2187793.1 hypothetical protein [Actinomycetospora soli]